MSVFVDTSALYALLDRDEAGHAACAAEWERLGRAHRPLVTSNYVLVETTALVQRRLGLGACGICRMPSSRCWRCDG